MVRAEVRDDTMETVSSGQHRTDMYMNSQTMEHAQGRSKPDVAPVLRGRVGTGSYFQQEAISSWCWLGEGKISFLQFRVAG